MGQQGWRGGAQRLSVIPVRVKLTLAMVVLALGPLVVAGTLVLNRMEEVVVRQLAADSQAVARERALQMDQELGRLQNLTYSVSAAQVTRFLGADRRQREEHLNAVQAATPGLQRLALLEPNGTVIALAPRDEDRHLAVPEAVRNG